jgi:GntR family transcriptional regulator
VNDDSPHSRRPAIAIDIESEVPIYQQIADELRRLIARGDLRDGDVLPSVRELGGSVGVNINTVARAYRILAEEGLVDLRHGASARVRHVAPKRVAAATVALVDESDRKRLDDLISRWVLRGADKRTIKRLIDEALERYFDGGKP